MALFRVRSCAQFGAFLTLLLLASCADHRSALAPTTPAPGRDLAAMPGAITPGTERAGGPTLTLYNSNFRHTYHQPGYFPGPEAWVELEVLAGEPVTVNWFGRFRGGAHLRSYRWTLDIVDLFDETPRINEATDLSHWSVRSATVTSATVGPFAAGEQHFFYVDVEDSNGWRSLGILHMTVVAVPSAEEVRRVSDRR